MLEKQKRFEQLYMDIAKRISHMSYATRLNVGAVLVKDDNIISFGWNGMPKGLDNKCEYTDENGNVRTKDEVLHAEQNVISKAARSTISTVDSTLYITHSPCVTCAKMIQQAGIKEVIFDQVYRDDSGVRLLIDCGIKVKKYDV